MNAFCLVHAQAIFSIYGGSEGKITVVSVKVSVLESAGLVPRNSAGMPSAEFCQKTMGHFIKVLETESTDTALVVALESFATWVKKFRENAASSQLTDFLAKGLALKTSTSPVRSAYFQLILTAILSSGTPDAFKALAPTMLKVSTIQDAPQVELFTSALILLQTLESAGKQPTNWALVSEAAHAASCLAKMNLEPSSEFWKTVNEGQLLVNDRFLTQVTFSLPPIGSEVLTYKYVYVKQTTFCNWCFLCRLRHRPSSPSWSWPKPLFWTLTTPQLPISIVGTLCWPLV